jgi:hypothetical protein
MDGADDPRAEPRPVGARGQRALRGHDPLEVTRRLPACPAAQGSLNVQSPPRLDSAQPRLVRAYRGNGLGRARQTGSIGSLNIGCASTDTGDYAVYVKYPVVSGAATNASFQVSYDTGPYTTLVDQTANTAPGGWVRLGAGTHH